MIRPATHADIPAIGACVDVAEVEKQLLDFPQVPCPVRHHFGPGIYIREVFLPAGSVVIGHFQKTEHMNSMIAGKVIMLNDDGTTKEVSAPQVFVGKPGRKIGYIVEDVTWQNIYPTTETDIQKLEATYLDKTEFWLQKEHDSFVVAMARREEDRADFVMFLEECGIDAETVHSQSVEDSDLIPMPYGWPKVAVFNSCISGKGLFATDAIKKGEKICPSRINGKRTPAGRYTNHSKLPNAEMAMDEKGDAYLFAIADIQGCVGGGFGEEITVDYRNYKKVLAHKAVEICQE
jgi:hypothetical protein